MNSNPNIEVMKGWGGVGGWGVTINQNHCPVQLFNWT